MLASSVGGRAETLRTRRPRNVNSTITITSATMPQASRLKIKTRASVNAATSCRVSTGSIERTKASGWSAAPNPASRTTVRATMARPPLMARTYGALPPSSQFVNGHGLRLVGVDRREERGIIQLVEERRGMHQRVVEDRAPVDVADAERLQRIDARGAIEMLRIEALQRRMVAGKWVAAEHLDAVVEGQVAVVAQAGRDEGRLGQLLESVLDHEWVAVPNLARVVGGEPDADQRKGEEGQQLQSQANDPKRDRRQARTDQHPDGDRHGDDE